MILNVNVPDLPYDELAGFEVTRLGHRHRAEAVVRGSDPRGRPIYWVGAAGAGAGRRPGHRLPCGRAAARLGHAAAGRPDAPRGARLRCASWLPGAGRVNPDTERHRHDVARARASGWCSACAEQGIRDERVLRSHPQRAAPPVRRRGAREPRLRGHGAADRPRPDDLAALRRRAHDRGAASSGGTPEKVLEIGTGCGYQTAVLAPLVGQHLQHRAHRAAARRARRQRLRELGIRNVRFKHGDGVGRLALAGAVRRHPPRGRAACHCRRSCWSSCAERRSADRPGRAGRKTGAPAPDAPRRPVSARAARLRQLRAAAGRHHLRCAQPAARGRVALAACAGDARRPAASRRACRAREAKRSIRSRVRYGLDYREIARWNGIGRDYLIHPGQRLRLDPPPRGSAAGQRSRQAAPVARASPADPAHRPPAWRWPVEGGRSSAASASPRAASACASTAI